MTTAVTRSMPWSAIESEELSNQNWIQVAFRNVEAGHREYRVFGEVYGEPFSEHYYSDTDDTKRLAYDYYWEKLEQLQRVQTFLFDHYEVWDADFVDSNCESCAVKFAKERNLEWRGGKSTDSFTENSEELGAGASCTPSWALGETDYPQTCGCGVYLKTDFTPNGVQYLLDNFPKGIRQLYGY
jgi:hypothetical protein